MYFEDAYPNGAFPPPSATGWVVEGLGAFGCPYSQTAMEAYTIEYILFNIPTFTEISPQSGCGTISEYEGLLKNITSAVEGGYGFAAAKYWAGFMLDEEPGYGFSASQLETLNSYAMQLMLTTPGVSWYAGEDQPNGWTLGTYNAILGDAEPAPQVYSGSMDAAVNSECTTYGECSNLVTTFAGNSAPWNSASYAVNHVAGSPFLWGSRSFYNIYQSA